MYMTIGVLPVPPIVRLPTLITGMGSLYEDFNPQLYILALIVMARL